MKKTRICLICSDMARNSYGRAYVLARALSHSYQVRVVGLQFGKGIWPPMVGVLEADDVEVSPIPTRFYPRFIKGAKQLWQAIDGDVIYALKPYPTSFGFALAYQQRYGKGHHVPLLLDIDDWELGNHRAMSWIERLGFYIRALPNPNHILGVELLYQQVHRADAITVSSRFIQAKYGGVLVPHGRDTDEMDPAKVSGEEIRREFGLEGQIVMFFGTPRAHKGIEDMIAAVAQLQRPNVTCVIVGANLAATYDASLANHANAQVRLLPMQSFDRVPAFMAAADVVVVPQRQTLFAEAQMPAKIYDAMAMARPIVSTSISDIPETLAGCGKIVPPGDVNAMAEAIGYLLDNPEEARQLGLAARAKCVVHYSLTAMQHTLETLVEQVLANGRQAR